MRYNNPIVTICQVPEQDGNQPYTKTHVLFQSTGATQISGVNNLPSAGLYATTKKWGKGHTKRVWGIEQNEGRETYLSQYWDVDNVDPIVSITSVHYIC